MAPISTRLLVVSISPLKLGLALAGAFVLGGSVLRTDRTAASLDDSGQSACESQQADDGDTRKVLRFSHDRLARMTDEDLDQLNLADATWIMFDPDNLPDNAGHFPDSKLDDTDVMRVICRAPNVEVLEMYQAAVTNDVLETVGRLEKLVLLNLDHTEISNQGLAHLKSLPRLRMLYLSGCPINSRGLRHLSNIQTLEVLVVSGCFIDNDGVEHLVALKKLKYLDLVDTKISDAALYTLQSLPDLERLQIYGNREVHEDAIEDLKRANPKIEIGFR